MRAVWCEGKQVYKIMLTYQNIKSNYSSLESDPQQLPAVTIKHFFLAWEWAYLLSKATYFPLDNAFFVYVVVLCK